MWFSICQESNPYPFYGEKMVTKATCNFFFINCFVLLILIDPIAGEETKPILTKTEIPIAKVSASTFIKGKKPFPPDNLIDGVIKNTWQAKGGAAWIELHFNEVKCIDLLAIANGFQHTTEKYGDLLLKNNRIATLRVGSDKRLVSLPSEPKGYDIIMLDSPHCADKLRIDIVSIHRGSKWDDLVVGEIRVFGPVQLDAPPKDSCIENFMLDACLKDEVCEEVSQEVRNKPNMEDIDGDGKGDYAVSFMESCGQGGNHCQMFFYYSNKGCTQYAGSTWGSTTKVLDKKHNGLKDIEVEVWVGYEEDEDDESSPYESEVLTFGGQEYH